MHHITKYGEILFLMKHIQQERVILVNENYHLPARLLIGTLYQVCQLDVNLRIIVFRQAIFPIIFPQLTARPDTHSVSPCPDVWPGSYQSVAPDIPSTRFPAFR